MTVRTIGPFRIERQLGAGGMGIVYLATHVKANRIAALKVLSPAVATNPGVLARFDREMAILKKLQHPNVVRYYGGDVRGESRYYAMEFVDGGSLEDELKRRGPLPWEEVVSIGLQVCAALDHAHGLGVVHRDLKPGNLFLAKDGCIKLGDFGIARDNDATALTAAGKTVGTYAYMAPEQIDGRQPIAPKTDLYALGCVLFELLTGRTPFQGKNAAEMLFKHLQETPPKVREIATETPIWLENLIRKLLAKDPAARPFDALAVQAGLEEVRQKVSENASVARESVMGGATAIGIDRPDAELQKLVKKKKPKKRETGPFYERAWFLATCLLVVAGGVAWSLWPLSEDEFFRRATPLMASDDPADWQTAKDKYLLPMLERFPEGTHATEAQTHLDKLDMHAAEQRAMTSARLNREPRSEAERLFLDAYRYEQFGDRITALEKYRSLANLLKDRPDDRAFWNLARKRTADIESDATATTDRLAIVESSLKQADEHFRKGRVLEANKLWSGIVTLYGNAREFEPQVRIAQRRLDGNHSPEPPPPVAPPTETPAEPAPQP